MEKIAGRFFETPIVKVKENMLFKDNTITQYLCRANFAKGIFFIQIKVV